jgi:hypothetical protein
VASWAVLKKCPREWLVKVIDSGEPAMITGSRFRLDEWRLDLTVVKNRWLRERHQIPKNLFNQGV